MDDTKLPTAANFQLVFFSSALSLMSNAVISAIVKSVKLIPAVC